jgi:hypothetical protein
MFFPLSGSLKRSFAVCLTLLCGSSFASAEARSDWFPFVVPTLANERTSGTPIDLSWLNPNPAGTSGFVRADGERLVDEQGQEVRLFGTNICDWHAVMPKEYATPVARRLRELGFNFIRLHYFDYAPAPEGIMAADMQSLDPAMLDRFHYLVAQLKAHGIYVDINLHVARAYPGQPPGWQWMGKGIDRLLRPFLESQKQYARELLSPVNPYTGLSLLEDPAVAFIELNNENTALCTWTGVELADYARLPEEFSGPLRALWNEWLSARYRDSDGLRKAWGCALKDAAPSPELLRDGQASALGSAQWIPESSGGAAAELTESGERSERFTRWRAMRKGTARWSLQLNQIDLALVPEKTDYVLTFEARSPDIRTVEAKLMLQQAPWTTVSGPVLIPITPDWKVHRLPLLADSAGSADCRLTLSLLNELGVLDIRAVSLRAGAMSLSDEETNLDALQVPLVTQALLPRQMQDYLEFLAETERAHSRELRDYLREELKARSLIIDSQASYGGLHGLVRESHVSDVVDMHAYPFHPEGNGRDAAGNFIWMVRNESLTRVNAPAYASAWRLAGRPFGMSEFDINPPNDHAAESYQFLALAAAFQGWGHFAEYSWLNFQKDYNPERIQSSFATTGHAGQMATIPASALLYRLGLVRSAATRAVLRLPRGSVAGEHGTTPFRFAEELFTREFGAEPSGWRQGLAIELVDGSGRPTLSGANPPEDPLRFSSDTGEIIVDRSSPGRELIQVVAPAYRQLTGFVGGSQQTLGDLSLEVASGTRNGYAHISVVSLDGRPIADSRRLLLTALARVENAGMVYTEDRRSVGGDYGQGPTLAEPVGLTLRLPQTGWSATALAGDGTKGATWQLTDSVLQTDRPHATVWYLLTRD